MRDGFTVTAPAVVGPGRLGLGISVLICGGIGPGAQDALASLDITVIPGITGDVDQAVQDFVDGKLVPNTEALCNHHHEGAAHNCGAHSCGTGGCHSH